MSGQKFKSLVHYIIEQCNDKPTRLGATKLNKICWYADAIWYDLHDESMTGEKYVKRQYGPVPAKILETLKKLEQEDAILVRDEKEEGYCVRVFQSLKKNDNDGDSLSEQQKSLVSHLIHVICYGHSASSISEISHDRVWAAADNGEEIPMYAILAASPAEISDPVIEWVNKMLLSLGNKMGKQNVA